MPLEEEFERFWQFFHVLGGHALAHLWWFTLIYIPAFWLYYKRITLAEEAFPRKKLETNSWRGQIRSRPLFRESGTTRSLISHSLSKKVVRKQ